MCLTIGSIIVLRQCTIEEQLLPLLCMTLHERYCTGIIITEGVNDCVAIADNAQELG